MGEIEFPLGMWNMNLRRVYTLQNQVSNKQTSLYCLVLLALSHQLYSLRGLHIGNISSPTVTITKRSSFNYFPLSLSAHIVIVTYHFCCCQYQLLSSTFNFLFTTLNTQDNIHSIRRNATKQWYIIFPAVSIQRFVTKT